MNSSMFACNQLLHKAYTLFQSGKLEESINQYSKALKVTYSQTLKNNIKCTMSVIYNSLGNHDKSIEIISPILKSSAIQEPNLIMLRIFANLTLMEILEGKFNQALDYFQMMLQLIQREDSIHQRQNCLQFATYLFFRVKNLEQISENIENMDLRQMTIEQIYSMSLMAFSSSICNLQCQQKIQKICYQQFLKHNRYDLAVFSLRSLIKFTKNTANKQFYEKQLAKLIMMGYFNDSIDYNNFESLEIIQAIAQQFVSFRAKIIEQFSRATLKSGLSQKSNKIPQSNDHQLQVEWKYTISLMIKQANRNKQIDAERKRQIYNLLNTIKHQKNILVIRNMISNTYFKKHHEKIQIVFKILPKLLASSTKNIFGTCLKCIRDYSQSISVSNKKAMIDSKEDKKRISIKGDRNKSSYKNQQDKENCNSLGISIVSASSKNGKDISRKKIFTDISITNSSSKKILKMVRLCEHGAFLNKRNFNSEGGQFKFVKITSSFIKWGKDPEKIETNCQIYPIKDIKSIIYGRVSPNLNDSSNKLLNYSKCFSLLLQKRTLDFYCKNYEELQTWVCGISYILKKQEIPAIGYTPGKLRWKKMFAILRQHFIEPLRSTERNKYYYENAYSLKLFAKNGYKLPSKHQKK